MRPYTDHNKIVFPWDNVRKDFSSKEFSPARAAGLLTYRELDQVLNTLSTTPNWDANMDCMTCLMTILASMFCLSLCVVPILLVMLTSMGMGEELFWLIGMTLFLLLFAVFTFICYRQQSDSEDKRMMRREEEIKDILEEYNEKMFHPRGCYWDAGYGGSYLVYNLPT